MEAGINFRFSPIKTQKGGNTLISNLLGSQKFLGSLETRT
jgi:hypothetical protein